MGRPIYSCMDRLARIFAIALLVGVFGYSVSSFQRTIPAATPSDDDQELVLPIEAQRREAIEAAEAAAREKVSADDPPPLTLAFVEGYVSGRYTIEYAPITPELDPDDPDRTESSRANSNSDENDDTDVDTIMIDAGDVVPGTMPPGLYATAFGVEDCRYEIRRIISTSRSRTVTERLIGEDYLPDGRMLVSFNEIEPDIFTARPTCGDWVPWSPVAEPLTVAADGDYWVGDLARGTWSVPDGCMWEKVVAFRGAELVDVEDSAIGPRPLIVDDETLGVRIRGCGVPMELRLG